jgi:hypothetical protein
LMLRLATRHEDVDTNSTMQKWYMAALIPLDRAKVADLLMRRR